MSWGDFKYRDIIHRCFRCGYCKFPVNWADVNNCPAYARFRMETYSSGGRLWLIRAWFEERINWTEHLAEILYSCTTCKNCVIKCPLSFNIDIVNMVVGARSEMVERGTILPDVKKILENTELYGNPYGLSKSKRSNWVNGTGIDAYDGQEYLLFIGCAASYDIRALKSAKALGQILKKAGVSFGILGNEERCDGNEIQMLGESGLFEVLARENIATFKKHNVRKIITLSPHAYNAIKNFYPQYSGKFKVYHYTQMLSKLMKEGRLAFRAYYEAKVTYHDPCFLGRWNEEYGAPRNIINGLPGIQFVEMVKNSDGALCCGGGGGNFIMDLLGGSKDSPSRRRIRDAAETGVNIVATACPKCLIMLEDAAKEEDLEEKISIRDISEIVLEIM